MEPQYANQSHEDCRFGVKKPRYKPDDFLEFCRCKKRKIVALAWKNLNLVAYGVNHGMNEECSCVIGVRTPNCIHAEDMLFSGTDKDIYHGCVLEINWFPCDYGCADKIIEHKIKAVCWTDGKHFEAIDKLQNAGIECFYGSYEQYLNRSGEVEHVKCEH